MVEVVMSLADEALKIGGVLVAEHHQELLDAEILYVFTNQRRKRCDRIRLGSAAKLNALQRFLASGLETVESGHDFLIVIDVGEWVELNQAQRHALVDHELSHCALFVADSEGGRKTWRLYDPRLDSLGDPNLERRWGLRGHDVEEFAEVLKRHGWWKPDAREKGFGEIALQLNFATSNGQVDNEAVSVSAGRRRRGTKAAPAEDA